MSENDTHERTLEFDDSMLARELFGPENAHVASLEKRSGVQLHTRGSVLTIRSQDKEAAEIAAKVFFQAYGLLKAGTPVFGKDLEHAWTILSRDPSVELKTIFRDEIFVVSPRKSIAPKTLSQKAYVQAMREHDMVFAIGPAGTGKTYLAVAMAVKSLMAKQVKRIILTRPAVEAGERLGFLPGDMKEKVNPYLRPLYDALHDMLDFQKVADMMETGAIEIAPLAYMRGRTLNDSYIILDEAQNTTPEQMKMFLTRLGFGSKVVVTGDVTQIDLPPVSGGGKKAQEMRSGLVNAAQTLKDVKGLSIMRFHEDDVIRHRLVARIVQAYERHAEKKDH